MRYDDKEQLSALKESQRNFIDMIREDKALPPNLSPFALEKDTSHRLHVYRDGFFGRLISAMNESILERAANFMGEGFMIDLLGKYYTTLRPPQSQIFATLESLPEFIDEAIETEEFPFLSDLIRVCIQNLELLRADDPIAASDSTDMSCLFLQPCHRFVESNHALYSIWAMAESKASDEEQAQIPNEAQGVLLIKVDPYSVNSISVRPELFSFVEKLQTGISVEAAIESCEFGDLTPETFQSWFSILSHCGGLVVRSEKRTTPA